MPCAFQERCGHRGAALASRRSPRASCQAAPSVPVSALFPPVLLCFLQSRLETDSNKAAVDSA